MSINTLKGIRPLPPDNQLHRLSSPWWINSAVDA